MSDEFPPKPEAEDDEVAPVIAEASTGQPAPIPTKADSSNMGPAKSERPRLVLSREALYRESRGYRMRLEPADLARLRELPGSRGLSDQELGEAFFDGQTDRFTEALSEDVPAPADIRVVVDPYSRQAFLALENKIRAILSF
jgi:hypothetical protein